MSLTNDAELRELFTQEMGERVEALVVGARAMVDGSLTEEVAGTMFREGHTVKGTSRVMGYEAISRAGKELEDWWRRVHKGEHEGDPALGELLGALAASVISAIDADPDEGSGELIAALGRLAKYSDVPAGHEPAEEVAFAATKQGLEAATRWTARSWPHPTSVAYSVRSTPGPRQKRLGST